MRSLLIIGVLSLILGGAMAYIQYNNSEEPFLTFAFIIGILLGAGSGLIVGAIGGYGSKTKSAKKKARTEQEMRSKIEDVSSTNSSEN
ncbi:MAG: hypothetical protein LBP34_06670 [Flavobacteriaceae bacterium]|jgi:hypothetical protein|nr:hypothetical protein [Flavobacteriaceae bacterium]